jgi:hypothetical protein
MYIEGLICRSVLYLGSVYLFVTTVKLINDVEIKKEIQNIKTPSNLIILNGITLVCSGLLLWYSYMQIKHNL